MGVICTQQAERAKIITGDAASWRAIDDGQHGEIQNRRAKLRGCPGAKSTMDRHGAQPSARTATKSANCREPETWPNHSKHSQYRTHSANGSFASILWGRAAGLCSQPATTRLAIKRQSFPRNSS